MQCSRETEKPRPPSCLCANQTEDSSVHLHCEVLPIPRADANRICRHAGGNRSGDTSAMQTSHTRRHSYQDTREQNGPMCHGAIWGAGTAARLSWSLTALQRTLPCVDG